MPFKFKINILFFCLYLGGIGNYFLNQIIDSKLTDTVITLIIEFLIVVITVSFIKLKSKYFKYLIFFVFISSISYLISDNLSLLVHINGIRETLVLICYFVIFNAIYKLPSLEKINNNFISFSYIFLAIQIPVSILQFREFGVGDDVGGTYGRGGSGLLTLSIFILIFYLIENKIKIGSERLKKGIPLLIFLIPVALNETKISFLLFFLYFLSLINLKKISYSIFAASLGPLFMLMFSNVYTTQSNVSYDNPLEGIYNIEYIEKYVLGDRGSKYSDVPRFTKVVIGTQILITDGNFLFGKDYGAFKGSKLEIGSEFSIRYKWLLSGSRPYSFFLLISGGIVLLLFITWMIMSEIFSKHPNNMKNYSSPLLFFLAAIFLIILLYNDAFRSNVFSFIFVFVLFFAKHFKKKSRSRKLNHTLN